MKRQAERIEPLPMTDEEWQNFLRDEQWWEEQEIRAEMMKGMDDE